MEIVLLEAINALCGDPELCAKYWFETALGALCAEYYITPFAENVCREGNSRVDILFLDVREHQPLERAIVALLKRFIYTTEEWADDSQDDLSEVEWEKYLGELWMPRYLPEPVEQPPTLNKERGELKFHMQTVWTPSEVQAGYDRLLRLLPESEIVHLADAGFYECCFYAYAPATHTLCLYDWWLNC